MFNNDGTLNFDASQVAPSQAFETLPTGWYNAIIDDAEIKPTKAGDGAYINYRFSILDGQYKGQKVWAMLNMKNPNSEAERIAREQLSALCHAVGRLQINHIAEVKNIPLQIRVKLNPADDRYDANNSVVGYKVFEGGNAGMQPPAAPMPPAQAPATYAPQPWQQNQPQPPAAPAQAPQAYPPQGYAQPTPPPVEQTNMPAWAHGQPQNVPVNAPAQTHHAAPVAPAAPPSPEVQAAQQATPPWARTA